MTRLLILHLIHVCFCWWEAWNVNWKNLEFVGPRNRREKTTKANWNWWNGKQSGYDVWSQEIMLLKYSAFRHSFHLSIFHSYFGVYIFSFHYESIILRAKVSTHVPCFFWRQRTSWSGARFLWLTKIYTCVDNFHNTLAFGEIGWNMLKHDVLRLPGAACKLQQHPTLNHWILLCFTVNKFEFTGPKCGFKVEVFSSPKICYITPLYSNRRKELFGFTRRTSKKHWIFLFWCRTLCLIATTIYPQPFKDKQPHAT